MIFQVELSMESEASTADRQTPGALSDKASKSSQESVVEGRCNLWIVRGASDNVMVFQVELMIFLLVVDI